MGAVPALGFAEPLPDGTWYMTPVENMIGRSSLEGTASARPETPAGMPRTRGESQTGRKRGNSVNRWTSSRIGRQWSRPIRGNR